MNEMLLHSNIKDYTVTFEDNFTFLKELQTIKRRLVIVDRNVYELYGDLLGASFNEDEVMLFDAVEENKTIYGCVKLYEKLTEKALGKNVTIISIGGGITQDVTGFVASTFYRGVNWLYIPTTFLAQTDSCIGSKTSLNFKNYKNLIGTFYPPQKIYICPQFLNTLTPLDFANGLGEAIKLQLMKAGDLKDFEYIKNRISRTTKKDNSLVDFIKENLQIKISYMKDDEFDRGRRNLLNYGHCFGHALETTSRYVVPHGVAVLIGIHFANVLSSKRGLLPQSISEVVFTELIAPNIALELDAKYFEAGLLLRAMKQDKKKTGPLLTVVVPNKQYDLISVTDVTDQEAQCCLDNVASCLCRGEAN